ncbi:hypothetical protein [Streptomyces sp. NPDC048340]|uniref:hypothetical protein n=1 Tax=Streptomyces sp. NPDC048340 TaxID=3365537 RepID=UPI003719168F
MQLRSKALGIAAATATAAGLALVPATSASAAPAGAQSLASCIGHYANTAYWMDCTGGSETSWARLGGLCGPTSGISYWNWSNWYRIDPGESRTISAECNARVWGQRVEVRPY